MRKSALFLIIVVSIISCHDLYEDVTPAQSERTINYISAAERPAILEALKDSFNRSNVSNRSTAVNTSATIELSDLNLERVMEVIDTLNNTHYTFRVKSEDSDPFSFTNLIIRVENQTIQSPYLIHYQVDEEGKEKYINSGFSLEHFNGILTFEFLSSVVLNDGFTANLNDSRSSSNCEPQLDFTDGQTGNTNLTGDTGGPGPGPNGDNGGGSSYITYCYDIFKADYSDPCWIESNEIYQYAGNSSGDIFNQGFYWNPDCGPQPELSYVKVRRCQTVYLNHSVTAESECLGIGEGDVGILPNSFNDFLK
ncbi:hypothetical protein [Roseivirga misakiensis]|uniref:Lipoprotein n=1 Tax=Roseivirga misakiensis TaxID=1563681 RepID=A0A1E5T230_9BACT|nr:hypothetical protein [Roseivirga misakiensis]OEK05416.1 hypothetical protein BFP71_18680 [Roseivirga misakiensis]